MVKFSIILTTYNSEDYIARTISSILNQKGLGELFEIELIVVDDHSNDNTLKIIGDFEIKPYLNEENSGGPNKGRNLGLEKSTGDYIIIADHDDEWLTDRLITVIPFIGKAQILTSSYILNDHHKKRLTTIGCSSFSKKVNYYSKNETFLKRLSKSKTGQNCYLGSIVFHKNLKHLQFEVQVGSIDFDWLLNLFQNKSSQEICHPSYVRHVYQTNLSLSEKYRIQDFEFSINCLRSYEKTFPKHVKKGTQRLFGTMGKYYYLAGDMKKSRQYFKNSGLSFINILYMVTSYCCPNFVRNNFKIFG